MFDDDEDHAPLEEYDRQERIMVLTLAIMFVIVIIVFIKEKVLA